MAVLLAVVGRLLLDPVLGERFLFGPFLLAIVFATWQGWGPSLVASVLSLLAAAVVFFPPRGSLAVEGMANQLGFVLNAGAAAMIVLSAELWRRAARLHELRVAQDVIAEELAERRRVEDALRTSHERIRAILESITDSYVVLDYEWRIREMNERAASYFHLRREDVLGRNAWEVLPRAIGSVSAQQFQKAARQRVPLHFEAPLQTYEGHWVEVHVYPSADAMSIYFRDITARKQAEQALREAHEHLEATVKRRTEQLARANAALEAQVAERSKVEEHLRQRNELLQTIIDNIPVMLTFYDPSGRFRLVNKAFEQLIGWSAEEVNRIDLMEAVYPDPEYRKQVWEFMAAAHRGWRDFVITTRWGARLESSWANIRLSDGSQIGIGLDITERKKAQTELEALNRALEQRAEQLQAMALQLTQSEEGERRRLAQILHDHLQQLLVAARMKVGTLRRRTHEENQRLAIEQIDELLKQSISESRSLTVELSPPVLYNTGLAAGLAWLARQTEEKHGLAVQVRSAADAEPAGQTTKVLLFQAVRELLFNIVKHAQATCAEVEMSRAPDGQLRIEVRDDGTGFDPALVAQRTGLRGGFGLFSIRERLELIGGRLEVDAAPGRGSRMVLLAPLEPLRPATAEPAAGSVPRTPQETPPVQASPSWEPGARTIRVLLADDHPILRKGLADVLDEHPGIELVGEAGDGEEVLEMARRIRPDVVVMDVSMPRLNGIEATRRMMAELPEVRVIGLSMHKESELASAMREAGAVAYLSKSHSSDVLVATILEAAAGREDRAGAWSI